ncbi:MAG: TIGR00730 family Rossman fold protein [Candidatus Eisenbacteria bacterium]|uniref:Cytokinin riboside 5'-monophosphate phosphoribohydrolase n=1 Tax=Eiseniibacteriota bacterium TaxID=2212470 RepID=A0A7Y2E630_UNCEI|nr:TIGR00730 family Rossman fold protein [Candidatus Eisenbacteria bacterium]
MPSSICVYCGSSPGSQPIYAEATKSLAEVLVQRGIRLVYGGASVGTMGLLADHVLALGGEAVGVIPESLQAKEIAHPGLTELHVTDSMHSRKARMAELSEGFIALPGGLGTLDELFEIWTWGQLGFHSWPIGLLNVDGYYDHLIGFLDHAVEQGFVKPHHRSMIQVASSADLLVDTLASYSAPSTPKL